MVRPIVLVGVLLLTACSTSVGQSGGDVSNSREAVVPRETDGLETAEEPPQDGANATPTTVPVTITTMATTTTTEPDPYAPPEWLGTVPLPLRADGHGQAQPTPPELEVRQIRTVDVLDPPAGPEFVFTIASVPEDVAVRSTWSESCPVAIDDLRYVTVSHFGFDGEFHTGELMVNARVADDIVEVFRALHEARYPIEEMMILSADAVEAPPTGDRNNTSAFECRTAVGSDSFSQHAYGLAIDVNPFQNPYVKGDLVLPELASAYLDRSRDLPGMIHPAGTVVEAFAGIGWQWGGSWSSLKDFHHFSENGR